MRIRNQQLTFLSEQQELSYEQRLTSFLQSQFADALAQPVDQLRPAVSTQIKKARSYQILTEQDIAVYVITAFLLGENFDSQFPAAGDVLTAQIPGEMKSKFLEDWTEEIFVELEGVSN